MSNLIDRPDDDNESNSTPSFSLKNVSSLSMEKQFTHMLFCQQIKNVSFESALKLLEQLHMLYLGQQDAVVKLAKQETADLLQSFNKADNKKEEVVNSIPQSIISKPLLSNAEIYDIASIMFKEHNIEPPDRFVTIEWFKDARSVPVPVNTVYCCTTYIKQLDIMISIRIDFIDSINEGYLSFLLPQLVENIDLKDVSLSLLEGDKSVGIAHIK